MHTILVSDKRIRGEKRIELLAVAHDIRSGLQEGLTIRMIHQVLFTEKKITCSYQRLRDFVSAEIRGPKQETTDTPPPLNAIPGSETLNQKPRAWNSKPDPKEIF